ncbi:hypothetical protein ACFL59_11930 [Planctomycetota bacterium]
MMELRESTHLCQWHVSQRRRHRKKRINKKWRKRYGTRRECVSDELCVIQNRWLMCCPHFTARILRPTQLRILDEGAQRYRRFGF